MPLPTSVFIAWLAGLGWDATQESGAPLVRGPRIRDEPDRLVTITPVPGPGWVLEAAADAMAFQARTRGPQGDQDTAEALAFQLDALIFNASFPVTVAGRLISQVRRFAGPPALLAPGPDDGDRYELTCTYLCIAAT